MFTKIYNPYLVVLRDFCETQSWHSYSVGHSCQFNQSHTPCTSTSALLTVYGVFQGRKLKGNSRIPRDRATVDITKSRDIGQGFIIVYIPQYMTL